jgi:hypothetical protein
MSTYFPTKNPAEKVILTFDFSSDLSGAELLTGTPTVAITSVFSADPSPTAVLNGAASLDATSAQVYQGVKGGVDGTSYFIEVTSATSNASKILVRTATLMVLTV